MAFRVTGDFIADHNRQGRAAGQDDFDHLDRLDPVGAFRASGYRRQKDAERPARMRTGGGIV